MNSPSHGIFPNLVISGTPSPTGDHDHRGGVPGQDWKRFRNRFRFHGKEVPAVRLIGRVQGLLFFYFLLVGSECGFVFRNTACQPEERKEERKTLPAVEPDRRVPERFSVKGKVGYKILGSQKYSCLKTRPWWALRPGFLGTHHEES